MSRWRRQLNRRHRRSRLAEATRTILLGTLNRIRWNATMAPELSRAAKDGLRRWGGLGEPSLMFFRRKA